jgi:trehalose synthase
MRLQEVQVRAVTPDRLEAIIGSARTERLETAAARARDALSQRVVLNVNSTAAGGGVAELLQTLLAYARGVGIDARWVVIQGDAQFFAITKRIHNGLYGSAGDGGALGPDERAEYEKTLRPNAVELSALLRAGDVVLLHDPQTAGLAPMLRGVGVRVVWRCHVGIDRPNEHSEVAWEFLRPYLADVDAFVFTRDEFAPPWIPRDRLFVIAPSIDPFSAKNEPMDTTQVLGTLRHVGLVGDGQHGPAVMFTRRDGSPGRINRHADILQTGPCPPADVPLVIQASRWDTMKDMQGVMLGFAEHVHDLGSAHLVLAGPNVHGVADDPDAAAVLDDCIAVWRALPHAARNRVHLACVPMADADEAAAIVNALQRHAAVVVQKSLAEGFGLTVAEAMWKGRPVVGSAVGGIVDQIVPGETGWLIENPHDLDAFAAALANLLNDPPNAARMGDQGRARASEMFLGDRHLEQWSQVFTYLG